MNIQKLLLVFSIITSICTFKVHGAYKGFSKISSSISRLLPLQPKSFTSSSTVQAFVWHRLPELIKNNSKSLFSTQQKASVSKKATFAQSKFTTSQKSQQKLSKKSDPRYKWYKRTYSSPLLGTGAALSLLEQNEQDTQDDDKPILLTKADVLKHGSKLKKEFIQCAIESIENNEPAVIEAIITIIELWPEDLLCLRSKVLRCAGNKTVNDDIITALEKTQPDFRSLYEDDTYGKIYKKAQQEESKNSFLSAHIVSPAIQTVVCAVPLTIINTVRSHLYNDGNPDEVSDIVKNIFNDAPQILTETVRTLPNTLLTGYITSKITQGAVGFFGIQCPKHNKETTNFGYYACGAITNFVLPQMIAGLVVQPLLSKASEKTGVELALWQIPKKDSPKVP